MSVMAMMRARTESLEVSRLGERACRIGREMTRIASDTKMGDPGAAEARRLGNIPSRNREMINELINIVALADNLPANLSNGALPTLHLCTARVELGSP